MPTVDDELQRRIHRAAPVPPDTAAFEGIFQRKRRRSITRRASAIGVVVLVLAGAVVAFAAVDRPNPVTPGVSTPAPLADDLGLAFPTCRVSSMPMTSELGGGSAAVFTKESDAGCPKEGDGFVGLGVDVTGDGLLDATAGPVPDCYFECEAFAAPDLNGDGVSEVAVSTAGADGFGVSLYAVTSSPPSLEPITVSNTLVRGPSDGRQLQFAWADVYAHASSAGCLTAPDGVSTFQLYSTEKLTPAQVQTTSMIVEGTTATVTAITTDTMPLDQAPLPGIDLCGAPIHGSAVGVSSAPGTYVGLDANLCDVSTLSADFDGDGERDTAYVGLPVGDRGCRDLPYDEKGVAGIDTDGDGLVDGHTAVLPWCLDCSPFAAIDFNADGASELAVLLQSSSTPQYGIYEAASAGSGREPGLYAAIVGPGSEQFPEGDPLIFLTGGDEGFSGAVKCEGFPDHPVLIVWASNSNVDGGVGSPRDVVMTKLTMQPDGSFAAVDALHQQQLVGDPPLFDGSGKACGVDWDPFQ